ncbi:methyltransferase domain-containing protein, partial [Candidatus Gottesmanbacteria bacterium]|nr:methyltransferase domain-containing protein [Candidatus Gottesmanbacteria bacterium]
MGKLINLVTPLHKRTKRDYIARMTDNKVEAMRVARKYEYDYWDGARRYGYGGYKYDGRWKVVAQKLIRIYKLNNKSKILDVGCGKAYLLFELKKVLPGAEVRGFDISRHGLKKAPEEIKPYLSRYKAQDKYP